MQEIQYHIYILASSYKGTLYIGMTSNLPKRLYEHRNSLAEGFTKQYEVHRLVYVETVADLYSARNRERQLKTWKREWKIELIEKSNPGWRDLSAALFQNGNWLQ